MVKQRSQKYLIDFSIATKKTYVPSWHHEVIAKKLEAVERGEIKRLMLFLPPRHGKSQLATINFPAWYLGRNPSKEVITASYSGELAQDFGGKTRDLVNSEQYQHIFGIKLRPDEQSRSKWSTEQAGTYTAVGVGGAITGRGANILIIDDPIKNREEADSEVYRDKVWNWYTSTAYTRLEKNGAVILIVTRWHFDDLAGRLLEQMKNGGEKWEIIRFPGIAEEDEEFRKIGEPLWPDKYDFEALNNIKQTIGLMEFSALYQQTPLVSELQEFKPNYFRYFEEEELEDVKMNINILIDPAISQKDTACNTGIIDVAKKLDKPFWYVMDDCSARLDPLQVIELVFLKVNEYRHKYPLANVRVFIETVAFQQAYMYFFKEEMKKRGEYFNINEVKTRSDKEGRIRGLIPMYKTGVILHRPAMKNGPLENELLQFPNGKFIDRADALSFNQIASQPTVRSSSPRKYVPVNSESLTGW